MKKRVVNKLIVGATLLAFGATPALAFGPKPSDAHPPGAIYKSTPKLAATKNVKGNMVNPPVNMRVVKHTGKMRSANVHLKTHPARSRHHAVAPR